MPSKAALLALGLSIMAGAGEFSLDGWLSEGESHLRTHAIISFGYAAAPLGRVLLIGNRAQHMRDSFHDIFTRSRR
jgi:hypothetical protein